MCASTRIAETLAKLARQSQQGEGGAEHLAQLSTLALSDGVLFGRFEKIDHRLVFLPDGNIQCGMSILHLDIAIGAPL